MFNILLLSPSDLQPPANAIARVERLYHKNGGKNVGVMFLLQEKSPQANGTPALMELQIG